MGRLSVCQLFGHLVVTTISMKSKGRSWMGILLLVFYTMFSTASGGIDTGGEIVSFYGSSHINVRLQEARSSSDIFFRLRTRRADSMLFLAAGRTDYCLLVLDAGRLKAYINLGAGEVEIASESPFLLNDMGWHTVNLTRRGSTTTIQIDSHITKANLPSRFHELNIHFGIWIGGLAGFNEIFLGNLPSFRGCISDVKYNSEDVILRAKTQGGVMSGVTWNCSEEFDAKSSDAYSLISPDSYLITRFAISRKGTTIKMNILSAPSADGGNPDDGLIFYASGVSSRPDFLALELRNGMPKFSAQLGTGPISLQTSTNITDKNWHKILIQVSPTSISVMVDNQSWSSELNSVRMGSRQLDVSEFVYLGVEDSKRSKLRSQGLSEISFKGCIRDLWIDEKALGLPEVDVSSNITMGCADCSISSSSSSCSSTSSTFQKSFTQMTNNFNNNNTSTSSITTVRKTVLSPTTVTNTYDTSSSNNSKSNNNNLASSKSQTELITTSIVVRDPIRITSPTSVGELEIMRIVPLQVAEGEHIIITPRHLAITLDLSKFGIRESGVLFRVSKPPTQGRLEVTSRTSGSGAGFPIGKTGGSETFSLLDVGAGRVRYWHNGAENSVDSIELILRLYPTSGYILPAYLQDERAFSLPVEVTPVNDPPEIRLQPGSVLRLAEGTKIRLTPDIISSLDPDTGPDQLNFTILSMGPEKKGFVELSSEQGKPIMTFTQSDLENGLVWYVDQGLSSSKMGLKVTDGSSVSQTAVLRVETFPLRIAPEVNSGLEVANVLGTSELITGANLSFTSNADGLIVQYHLIKSTRSGQIQLKKSNGLWTSTEHFTQLDLQNLRVRYLLHRPSDIASEDQFTFHVSLADIKVSSEFRFKIKIVLLHVQTMGLGRITLNTSSEAQLSQIQLKYQTSPLKTPDEDIKYSIVEWPKFGHLLGLKLKIGRFDFTQNDLNLRRISYKFKYTPYSVIQDYFTYNISTINVLTKGPQSGSSGISAGPFRFDINSGLPSKSPDTVQLRPLLVPEGGKEIISTKVLKIRVIDSILGGDKNSQLQFNITGGPYHGVIERERDYNLMQIVSQWNSADLDKTGLTLYYRHDGSESPKDKVEFLCWNSAYDFMYSGQLDIVIKGVNNNPPKRSPRSSLRIEVVTGGVRRLSREILDYSDDDWDSDRANLKYSTRGSDNRDRPGQGLGTSPFGNVYDRFTSLSRPIFQWTQADIDAGKLVFKHEGSDTFSHGLLPFWVTDGKFIVNGTIEISAGAPWVKIVNTTTLAGKRQAMVRFGENDIKIDTNVDVDQDRIIIRLIEGPSYGVIKLNQSIVVENFTLGDLQNRLLYYDNQAVHEIQRDSFRFEAAILNMAESPIGLFEIAIYPETYWIPLNIGANVSVYVNENSSAFISQASLHILNPHIPPNDVVYTLTRPPKHGYLAIDSPNSYDLDGGDNSMDVTMWDQTVINQGHFRYVQSEPNKTIDSMYFDVTNGVQTLKDLKLDFIIIPTNLILASTTIVVNEGGSQILNISHIHSAQNYFADKIGDLKIIQGPVHGSLTMISRINSTLSTFPYKALSDGKILYTHDGSESLDDEFTILGYTDGSEENLINIGGTSIVNSRKNIQIPYQSLANRKASLPHTVHVQVIPYNDQVPRIVNNTGSWIWAGGTVSISHTELAALDDDAEENQLTFYVVGTEGGFPALKEDPKIPLQNFTQLMINQSQLVFVHKGLDFKEASMDLELSDGLYEANKETFRVIVRKPEITQFEGRVPLAVFPFTQVIIQPENLLLKSSDARDIIYQLTGGSEVGQLLMEGPSTRFSPISSFSQTDVNNGIIFYQHRKPLQGQKDKDFLKFTASSSYADPVENVTVEIEISVSGAGALGGLQRYVSISPLVVKEGGEILITTQNINFSAVMDFINMQTKGNTWRKSDGITAPSLRLILSESPKHGELFWDRIRFEPPAAEVSPQLLDARKLKYVHDDSETTEDSVGFSLWLWTVGNFGKVAGTVTGKSTGNDSSIWLLNVTLPISITPMNDQPFEYTPPKNPILAVVQEHWRKLSRADLLTSDPDTPPAHILYLVSKISHGRFIMLLHQGQDGPTNSASAATLLPSNSKSDNLPSNLAENIKGYKSIFQFTQADINAGRVVYYHTGPVQPVSISLKVSDGQFSAVSINLEIPVQPLTLQSSQQQAFPIRISQGHTMMTLSQMNLPCSTNGHLSRLVYNLTRGPLHGKILFRERTALLSTFTHSELSKGDLSFVQTDLSVANDSFEISAHFTDISPSPINVRTSWLVNVVSVPLLKRVKEVRTFVKGFAIGGLLAPDESEFSVSIQSRTILNLALLDASPLAALTGQNPIYEILIPPKFGQLHKIASPWGKSKLRKLIKRDLHLQSNQFDNPYTLEQNSGGKRPTSRFSHEDIRRGFIVYTPTASLNTNELLPYEIKRNQASDEFIFKTLAPGVQPALAIAKFKLRIPGGGGGSSGSFYDDGDGTSDNEIISDGSTDLATKRSRGRSGLRDITLLVTPKMSKDSLVKIGIIIGSAVTLGLLIVMGIQCTCAKKKRPTRLSNHNNDNSGGGANGGTLNRRSSMNNRISEPGDPKCISNGMIDVYAPMIDTSCQSDSDTGGHSNSMRPLMMSSSTLTRVSKGQNMVNFPNYTLQHRNTGNYTRALSEAGSWASNSQTNSNRNSQIPTPSIPQCRVTPLCPTGHQGPHGQQYIGLTVQMNGSSQTSQAGDSGGSDSGGYNSGSTGGNSLLMCPLLPVPTHQQVMNLPPICDTFAPLPEEIDPPEAYGFNYGASMIPVSPLQLDICDTRSDQGEDETAFNEPYYNPHCNSLGLKTENLPMTLLNSQNLGVGNNIGTGTLGRNKTTNANTNTIEKNQYWV